MPIFAELVNIRNNVKALSKNKSDNKLLQSIVLGLQDRKGLDIAVLDLTKITDASFDYFVIAHGTSKVQTGALAESVLEKVRDVVEIKPFHKEGFMNAEWILLDYGHILVHVFQEDTRHFYNLEQLWADAKTQIINE